MASGQDFEVHVEHIDMAQSLKENASSHRSLLAIECFVYIFTLATVLYFRYFRILTIRKRLRECDSPFSVKKYYSQLLDSQKKDRAKSYYISHAI